MSTRIGSNFYSRNYIGWPPVPVEVYIDPDSWHWRELAKGQIHRMKQSFGGEQEAIDEYYRILGDPTELTWKQIYERLYEAAQEHAVD